MIVLKKCILIVAFSTTDVGLIKGCDFFSATYKPIESANLALRKRAWLSSTTVLRADNTVDGNTDPNLSNGCPEIDASVASSWHVDLEAVYDIKRVVIFTRPGDLYFCLCYALV